MWRYIDPIAKLLHKLWVKTHGLYSWMVDHNLQRYVHEHHCNKLLVIPGYDVYTIIYREREAIFVGEVQSCHSEIVICDDESAKIVICDDHDGPQILLHRII